MKLRKPIKSRAMLHKGRIIAVTGNGIIPVLITPCHPEADAEGWIETAKRKPKKSDADWRRQVLCWMPAGAFVYFWYNSKDFEKRFTHWQPAPRPPVKRGRKK